MKKLKFNLILFFLSCSIHSAFSQSKARIDIPEYYTKVLDYSVDANPYLLDVSKSKAKTRDNDISQVLHVEYINIENRLWDQEQIGIPNVLNLNINFKGENRIDISVFKGNSFYCFN